MTATREKRPAKEMLDETRIFLAYTDRFTPEINSNPEAARYLEFIHELAFKFLLYTRSRFVAPAAGGVPLCQTCGGTGMDALGDTPCLDCDGRGGPFNPRLDAYPEADQ